MCLPPMNTCGTEVRPVIARTEVVDASLPNTISSYGKPFTSNNAFAFEQNGQHGGNVCTLLMKLNIPDLECSR